jgi:endonuclease/exonuclease/phosphatase family metal-dependent hydrolase
MHSKNGSVLLSLFRFKSITQGCTLAFLILAMVSCSPLPESGIDFLSKGSNEHIRVMSFNVNWDSIFPDGDPQNDKWREFSKGAEFIRILKAVKPDILCLQEINPIRNPQQIGSILDETLPLGEGATWQAHKGHDNFIAARFDLTMEANKLGHSGRITNFGQAMALVDLPDEDFEEDIYLICTHFKSGGGLENVRARQEHADGLIEWVGDIKIPGGRIDLQMGTPFILLGDFNVYDTDPAHHLTTLLTGDIKDENRYGRDIEPDWDETSLADAMPLHNGVGEELYTWRDDTQEFNPGVLDRILFTDSVLVIENTFVLNTSTMTVEELEAAGLERADVMLDFETGQYDHLPLVVDISLRD